MTLASVQLKKASRQISKNLLWGLQRPFRKHDSWPCQILSGPAKGSLLTLDIRTQGSYWLGSYDKWILDRLNPISHLLPPGDIAWDCGAFVGYYSAVFRKAVGSSGKIVTFEASSRNCNSLRNLPHLNNWDNVFIHHLAVGPDHSTINFAGELGGSSGPVGLSKSFEGSPSTEAVQSAGLDELLQEHMMPAPKLIKLDLESAEQQALHNGHSMFTVYRPSLILEWHGIKVLDSIGRFLDTYHYSAWDVVNYHQDANLRETQIDPANLEKRARSGISNTLICLPSY